MKINLKVKQRLLEHYQILKNKGYNIVAIFVQGSQNYGLDEYDREYMSDVDTKAMVLPSIKDFIMNKEPVSTTLILDNQEHIDVKDIRLMFKTIKKLNSSYLELLYTPYKIIEPKYQAEMQMLFDARELMIPMDPARFVQHLAGMAMEKQKALCHPYPTLIDKIEKYGYDGKQLSHAARLYFMLETYLATNSFEQALMPTDKQKIELMNYKKFKTSQNKSLSKEEACKLMQLYMTKIQQLKESFLSITPSKSTTGAEILDKVQYQIMFKKIKTDVLEEKEGKKDDTITLW